MTTSDIPEANVPGHHPPVEQDKPAGPPPRPRRAKSAPKAGAKAQPTPAEQPKPANQPAAKAEARPEAEAGTEAGEHRFRFAFEPLLLAAGVPFGVTPPTTSLTVTDERLHIRFGPWALETPRSNIASATKTGPYSLLKVAGPAHISFKDGGVTFATNRRAGVCIQFHEPVAAALPRGLMHNPAATVTVEDPERLVALLT